MKSLANALVVAVSYICTSEDDDYANFDALTTIESCLTDVTDQERHALVAAAMQAIATGQPHSDVGGPSSAAIGLWMEEIFGACWTHHELAEDDCSGHRCSLEN